VVELDGEAVVLADGDNAGDADALAGDADGSADGGFGDAVGVAVEDATAAMASVARAIVRAAVDTGSTPETSDGG
jgi:hypothetical protein